MTNPTAGPDRPWTGEPATGVVQSLFGEHAADLLGYARRISPEDPGQAEDLVQETFLRAWRHRERLAVHANARAWLFQVTRNLAVDRHRRRAARPGESAPLPDGESRIADIRAADGLDAVLLRADLLPALRALSAPHRETLVALHCLDRTQHETAGLLDLPLGTVKSRHHVAVRELRRALCQRGIDGH